MSNPTDGRGSSEQPPAGWTPQGPAARPPAAEGPPSTPQQQGGQPAPQQAAQQQGWQPAPQAEPFGQQAAVTAPGWGAPQQQPKPRSRRVLWWVGGGALALVLAIVLVVVLVVVNAQRVEAEAQAAAQARADGASAIVTDYLQAIADGDAETAWSLVDDGALATQSELMTDEVLAASSAIAPITEIEVTPIDPEVAFSTVEMEVSFLLGDEPVTAEVGVSGPYDENDTDESWTIYSPLVTTLSIGADLVAAGATVNGVAVTGDQIDVFPGTYELAIDEPMLTMDGVTTVTATERYGTVRFEPELGLSDEGLSTFRSLVQDAVEICVASTSLDAGCGLDMPATLDDGTTVVDGTIDRSLPGSTQTTLDSLEATIGSDDPLVVTGEHIGSVDATFDCSQGGLSGSCELLSFGGHALGSPVVDLGADDPQVRWD